MQTANTVCVSNLRSSSTAVSLDIPTIIGAVDPGTSFEMKYYSDEILAIHVVTKGRLISRIYTISTSCNMLNRDRIVGCAILEPPDNNHNSKLFVRHTSRYCYYGTHTAIGLDGHRKWEIRGYAIHPEPQLPRGSEGPILLDDFHGNDIGSTVAFEIHDEYFYAVSNQCTYEVEEVDWTSFYHCVRFPLNNAVSTAVQKNTKVYRRQHADGAIHDSWTDLTLQHDEKTNDVLIIESRREWLGASSKQARTFYTSKLQFAEPSTADELADTPPLLPANDPLASLLDSSSRGRFMPTPVQFSWARHPENAPSRNIARQTERPFILARTKYRAYNYSCSTFLDLVEDERCCPNRGALSPPCLRLRIGSRRIAPISCTQGVRNNGHKRDLDIALGEELPAVRFADETQYRYTPIRLFPPPASRCPCSDRLHRIMNPAGSSCTSVSQRRFITACCDERSIVYMVKPVHTYSYGSADANQPLGTIVLVDFGRSASSNQHNVAQNDELRWDWTPGQEKRCMSGLCR